MKNPDFKRCKYSLSALPRINDVDVANIWSHVCARARARVCVWGGEGGYFFIFSPVWTVWIKN